ncbi:MAG: pyruvate dehydrogenase (acetyl-transferring) E1 component subunit alpha [Deltaproteobacteria bacterium]|nr:MAG: pyruvate dehydrogenase (acetyl-transferring) E1 component subunit alpha [Deltaproteobacteria bacterium]
MSEGETSYEPSRDELLEWYRQMALIRRFEELAAKAYTQRKILGFCHLYIGQEAVAVGASAALEPTDVVVSAYREHGHILARGTSPRAVMAELFGKGTGITQGVGGSMHLADRERNFWGGYGIVGGHLTLATGAAFAARYRQDEQVSLVYFGDGAAQQGAFFESLLLAQLWKLPVVFLCENNYYAMGTSIERYSALQDMSLRGDGVGMKRWQFQGFDVAEVYDNVKRAVDYARSGEGPVILEAVTYRYRGHSMSDPAKYRKKGELDDVKKKDALELVRDRLAAMGVDQDTLDQVKAEVNEIAQDAYDFAESSPDPDPARLYDYTYAPDAGDDDNVEA